MASQEYWNGLFDYVRSLGDEDFMQIVEKHDMDKTTKTTKKDKKKTTEKLAKVSGTVNVRFYFDSGFAGETNEEIMEFPAGVSTAEIDEEFSEWLNNFDKGWHFVSEDNTNSYRRRVL
jgi:hypothetical protein